VSPLRTCLRCGALISSGSYCKRKACTPAYAKRDPRRGSGGAASKLRAAVMKRDKGQCRALEGGFRCPETDPQQLEVHHIVKVVDGGSNTAANCVLLCRRHHRVLEAA
jgi:5-methylcytosine-specific restriction endonuclease McrA